MKLFAPALIFCGAFASFGQPPEVPHKMQFAGMTLTLRDDARREIQKDVDALTLGPKYFQMKAERAKTYFPIIEKIFEDERLPIDFKYLALQESALVADAVSSSSAVGFWQFKDFTAREMGLRVDAEVDERMNIASASRGAARYLKQCNQYFNNWVYALQAYQMGAGGVMRAVGEKDLGARHMEITTDTYWYVKKFLAHKVAFEQAMGGTPRLEVVTIYTGGGQSLAELSQAASVDEKELREINKWLKTEKIPTDKEYAVLIPKGKAGSDFATLALTTSARTEAGSEDVRVAEERLEVNGIPVIRAAEGESLSALAERSGIGIGRFLAYNEMEIDKPVKAGDNYFLEKKKRRATQELYTANADEDVWTISQRFGVRQKSLMKYNHIKTSSSSIAGITLFLNDSKPESMTAAGDSAVAVLDDKDTFEWGAPTLQKTEDSHAQKAPDEEQQSPSGVRAAQQEVAAQAGNTASMTAGTHEVRPSDTIYSVSRQYGVTIRDLMEWNDKKDFGLIVGEKLKVRSH